MKSNNPFCNACTEPDCLVSLDDTCAMIRAYKTSTTIGIDSEIEEQTDALIADLQGQILDLQQQLNDEAESLDDPVGSTAPLRDAMYGAVRSAERAAHAYAASCEVGEERTWAFEVFERIRLATRR